MPQGMQEEELGAEEGNHGLHLIMLNVGNC